ncbi:zinc finger DHHC-type palmitoyltransferase GABPI isoform X1 [Haematobia irritans]|uniref:zinc finger DHHC-type palmitoyltransferase GABPI isoform X1 n=2 Tax=Haematobia irritans TaxID=7368 RepID=UPI003F4F925F
MTNYDYIAVAQRAEEEESRTNPSTLCCCEYIDREQQRFHILACCCNCADFDSVFTSLITCQRVDGSNRRNMLLTFQDRLRIPWRGGAKQISMESIIPGAVLPLVMGLAALNEITCYIMLGSTIVFLGYGHQYIKRNHVKTKFFFMWLVWSVIYMIACLQFAVPLLELLPEENWFLVIMGCFSGYMFWLTRKHACACHDLPSRTDDDLADITEATAAEEEEEAAAHTALLIDNDSPVHSQKNRLNSHQTNMCHVCRKYVAARTIHCHVCNACVMMQSHHSYWLNCCVGQYNLRYYNTGLVSGILALFFGVYLTLTAICHPLLIGRIWNIPVTFPDDCSEVFDEYTLGLSYVLSLYAIIIIIYQLFNLLWQVLKCTRGPYFVLGDMSQPFSKLYKKLST